jgi:restriction system protein
MPIPDYQTIMLPLLKTLEDGKDYVLRDVFEPLAIHFRLTPEERKELLPSGTRPTFDDRVGWARTYLKKAGLVDSPKRGVVHISPRGKQVLASNPTKINNSFLSQFEEFVEFLDNNKRSNATDQPVLASVPITTQTQIPREVLGIAHLTLTQTETPEEALGTAYQTLRDNLSDELLTTIKGCSPAFFERLVVDVIVSIGYGGSRREAGRAIGGTGDDGIDGIINEDRLGLDSIYLQAKRWEGTVGRPEIQKFAGALQGYRARKGIFITTSSFTKDAQDYTQRIDSKIVLIDGKRLSNLMIDHNVGVTSEAVYEVKRTDSDYFSEG